MAKTTPPAVTSSAGFQLRLLLFGTLFFILLIGAVRFIVLRVSERRPVSRSALSNDRPSQTFVQSYEERAGRILTTLARADTADAVRAEAAVRQARQDLLALTVPAQYKDLHLSLVIGLSLIERGYSGDAAKLAAGQAQVSAALAPYAWAPKHIFK